MSTARQPSSPALAAALLFTMICPTIMAWIYFMVLGGGEERPGRLQQLAYAAAKIVQFAFPIVFVWITVRPLPSLGRPRATSPGRWSAPPPRRGCPGPDGLGVGLAFGLLVAGLILGLYFGPLRSSDLLAETPAKVRQKLQEFRVDTPASYWTLALFIVAAHSLLEEYYWRWFVFGQLRRLVPVTAALVLSSLAFMAHHVIILHAYFPGRFLAAVVPFALGVAVGGAFWAWLYQRTGSLLGPWLSHALVDLSIFVIGWSLMGGFGS